MLDKQQQADVARAADAVATALRDAVQVTVDEHTPDAARHAVFAIVETGMRTPSPDGGNPAAMMATYLLLHQITLVREALADRPDRVAEILSWIEENLGKRPRLRARYTSEALVSEAGVEEIAAYAEGLGPDFMPSLLWLLAGAVAVYADGDAEWISTLQEARNGREGAEMQGVEAP
ncbi:hypothetical protein [Pseudonocardia sp.]|uniref:hypothetical protein n=1 Tax=Pseudonocardia sp. TaxID=60912 RepID=UPI003D14A618